MGANYTALEPWGQFAAPGTRSLVTLEGGLRWKADLLGMGGFLEL